MFLAKDSKSPYLQVVYFVNGKRRRISTGTSDRKEAEKFLLSFNPKSFLNQRNKIKSDGADELKINNSILLSCFIVEYKKYIENTFSVKYLKKAVVPSFSVLQNKIPDMPLDMISTRIIDQFISSVAARSKFCASLYYRTLKAAFNKAVVWNYLEVNP
ncbi:MAG TPA: hypothetical protein VLN45_01665, partial [Ignavibacteriaceae bacterium]|nr:hypothetical protein [Ignavibacteriaceae bacterium]